MAYDPMKNLEQTRADLEKQRASGKLPEYRIEQIGNKAGKPFIRCIVKLGDNEYKTTVYCKCIPNLNLQVGDVVNVAKEAITLVNKASYATDYQI